MELGQGGQYSSSSPALCTICVATKNTADMFISKSCPHAFCTNCISNYIDSKVQANITKVKCPDPSCMALIDPQSCSYFLPKQLFDQWGDALCEALITGTQRFYCPFKDCSALMIADEDGSVTASECLICRRMFCAQCKVGWHAEMDCEEFQRLIKGEGGRDDILLMKLSKRMEWMRCSECKIYVEKIDGCVHITCRCGFEFCYRCGCKWSSSHESDCVNRVYL